MLPCEVQCVLTFAMAAEEEGDTWWSFCFCCGMQIVVWPVLLGAMYRDQIERLLSGFLVAVGWMWSQDLTHYTIVSPALFCSDKTMSGIGLMCSLGPTWAWLLQSCCFSSLHLEEPKGQVWALLWGCSCVLPRVPRFSRCAPCPSPLMPGFALPAPLQRLRVSPWGLLKVDRELVLQKSFLGYNLGGEWVCLHLLSDHCCAGLTSPSAQFTLLKSVSMGYCFPLSITVTH